MGGRIRDEKGRWEGRNERKQCRKGGKDKRKRQDRLNETGGIDQTKREHEQKREHEKPKRRKGN